MKYFISIILIINILAANFALAENFSQNGGYLIDQAGVFSDNLLDKKDIIKDLEEANQNPRFALKILTLESFGNKSPKNYCEELLANSRDNQILLLYNKNSSQIRYCCSDKNSTGVTDDEFNYIINEIVQPNIDGGHLTFALRIAIREISVASRENIAPENYKLGAEIERNEKNKQIIIFLFIIILFSWLTAYLGRTKAWWFGGVMGFGLGLFIWWVSDIWFFILLFLISGLVYDYFVSRHYKEYGSCKRGAFWCTVGELRRNKKKRK
jgi:uncharacterized membrane protein YgcG